ncbi:hypothetical protein GUJ93_ZPchr0260g46476 [Zizania palustris]|uniref:Uncharacterized protein n=1 Tax=Zizania palustris TaxID=103762 RepID=A0A8J5R121_ZIZPA|nr:hypothetical protein GUJ93_ZPchr0260g46476 [Zizania palustris]
MAGSSAPAAAAIGYGAGTARSGGPAAANLPPALLASSVVAVGWQAPSAPLASSVAAVGWCNPCAAVALLSAAPPPLLAGSGGPEARSDAPATVGLPSLDAAADFPSSLG